MSIATTNESGLEKEGYFLKKFYMRTDGHDIPNCIRAHGCAAHDLSYGVLSHKAR